MRFGRQQPRDSHSHHSNRLLPKKIAIWSPAQIVDMQKHKWLTKWSSLSMVNVCLQQNTMKNKKMGKIFFFCLAIFTCLCAFISNLLWWMFAFRLTGDGRNLRRQLDCSDPLIFIPPTHTEIWEASLPSAPFRKVNVLFEIRCFSPLFQLTKATKEKTTTDTWR